MPVVYFETESQNDEQFPGGGSEQYYLRLILDEIISCLNSNAISYEVISQDTKEQTTPYQDNNEETVLISLEMRSGEKAFPNTEQGIEIMFKENNPMSSRLAEILSRNIEKIYHHPLSIKTMSDNSTSSLTNINSISIVFGNLLNEENITWLRQNIEEISNQVIMSLAEYFGLPFISCSEIRSGMAKKDESLRIRPNLNSRVVGSVAANSKVNVLGQWEDWYIVGKNHDLGYIQTKFIEV